MKRIVLALSISSAAPAYAQAAPFCGEFLPMITEAWIGAPHKRVHFVPKLCNKVMIAGVIRTIPPGVAVVSGGVNTEVQNTCIDKVCGRPLRPNMLYRAYVRMDAGVMKLDFSVAEHKEDPKHGNEVHARDPARSFVGLVATDENGLICGGGNLCILSWFYRGHTGLSRWIGTSYGQPVAEVCGPMQTVPSASVKILTFGINSTFREAYSTPNIYATGTLTNTEVGKSSQAAIAIEWGGTPVSISIGSPAVVTWTRHKNLWPGAAISFSTTGTLPAPLVAGTSYYVKSVIDVNRFTISAKHDGQPIATSGLQSGYHIAIRPSTRGGPITSFLKKEASDAGALTAVAVGGFGAEEGWIKGTLMLGAPNGGCARVPDGVIYTSPHHS